MNTRFYKFTRTFTLLALLAWAHTAWAQLELNGMAVHTQYGQNQFVAAVYCESPTADARQLLLQSGNKAMELRIVADQIYPRRFKRMWIESMAINSAPQELEKHAQNMAAFSQMLRVKLRVGDNLRIEKQEELIRVTIDGHEMGTISDPSFFDLLLRTWVGPVPLSTAFKNGLLANGQVPDDVERLYYATVPIPERVLTIAAALTDSPDAEPPRQAQTSTSPAPSEADAAADQAQASPGQPQAQEDALAAEEPTASPTADTVPTETDAEGADETPASTTGLISEADLFEEESVLDDEEEITAESLLNQQLFISKLTRWTSGFTEYPSRALRREQEGTVRVLVVISRSGEVIEAEIEESSDHKLLNEAALKAVNKASPYPAIPSGIDGDDFAFSVPVVFRLR